MARTTMMSKSQGLLYRQNWSHVLLYEKYEQKIYEEKYMHNEYSGPYISLRIKNYSSVSTKTNVVGTQKNPFNEMALLKQLTMM